MVSDAARAGAADAAKRAEAWRGRTTVAASPVRGECLSSVEDRSAGESSSHPIEPSLPAASSASAALPPASVSPALYASPVLPASPSVSAALPRASVSPASYASPVLPALPSVSAALPPPAAGSSARSTPSPLPPSSSLAWVPASLPLTGAGCGASVGAAAYALGSSERRLGRILARSKQVSKQCRGRQRSRIRARGHASRCVVARRQEEHVVLHRVRGRVLKGACRARSA